MKTKNQIAQQRYGMNYDDLPKKGKEVVDTLRAMENKEIEAE